MTETLPHALEIWDNAARLALPLWLKAWLFVLASTFLASLFFVRRHMAARWAIAGFAVSHGLVILIEMGGFATLRTGLVSITHLLGWSPVFVVLIRALPQAPLETAYGVWCRMLLFIIGVSLIFDARDAVMYLYFLYDGHPAFGAS